jgi:hypothetical protein
MDEKELLKVEARKKLLGLDLNINSNQPAMKSILTDLEIECDGNSAAKLREVLTPVKESLVAETETTEVVEETTEVVEVEETQETEVVEETTEVVEKNEFPKGNFIMKVGHLPWGFSDRNHFFADKKPLINAKVMGNYADTLEIWLKAEWIEKGSYK